MALEYFYSTVCACFLCFFFLLSTEVCEEIPEEYVDTLCTAIAGSIEVILDDATRRRLASDVDEERIFEIVKEILDNYADVVSQDIDLVTGMQFGTLSRKPFEVSPYEPVYTNTLPIWRWALLALVVGGIIFTVFGFTVLRRNGRRLREVTRRERGVSRDRTSSRVIDVKGSSQMHFPLRAMESVSRGDNMAEEVVYDYEGILGCPISSFNAEEEAEIQRRQLMKEFAMPSMTALNKLEDNLETDWWYKREAERQKRNVDL